MIQWFKIPPPKENTQPTQKDLEANSMKTFKEHAILIQLKLLQRTEKIGRISQFILEGEKLLLPKPEKNIDKQMQKKRLVS